MLVAGILLASWQAPQAGALAAEPPHARDWDEFPVFVWREKYAGKPLPQELAEPFGGVILMREEDSSWARERGLSYLVWNVAGRDALHLDADEAWNARVEQWIQTHDEKLLVREPCLNDPKPVEELFSTLDATIVRHGEHPGLGFVLGDEVGLTPNGDPFDLCRCDFCEAKWKEFARKNELPERAPLTDEVRQALLEDDFSLLGPWLARRRFDQQQVLGLLRSLAERARGSEGRAIALLGLKERTAFGGIDLGQAARFLRVLEAYPTGDSRARLDALRRPHQATLDTVFLQDESPQGAAWLVWESWIAGADSLVLWNDADLARDRTRAERLASAVEGVRALQRHVQGRLRRGISVGLLHDADSIAAAWLRDARLDGPTWPRRRASHQDEHGTREQVTKACSQACEDLGTTLLAMGLDDDPRPEPAVWVLVEALVLDEGDVEFFERHLDQGRSLVVVGSSGWIDRAGHPWKTSVLQRLQARAPERVFAVDAPAATREGLQALLRRIGAGTPALRLKLEPGEQGWLQRSFGLSDDFCGLAPADHYLVALLPDAPTAQARSGLVPRRIELEDGQEVEWMHPRPGELLPPGDAAALIVTAENALRVR